MFGAKPKASFRPYQPLEPQPRGAVTRRAVAQRRSRAGGLTRLSAEAIRGFGLGFGCRFACQFRRRYGVGSSRNWQSLPGGARALRIAAAPAASCNV